MAIDDKESSAKAWVPPESAHWTEREARQMRDAFEKSGETVRAFVLRHGIKEHTVRNWLRRLRRKPPAAVFVPVHVKAETPEAMAAPSGPRAEPLELVLRGGHTVRLGRDFDVEVLRRLMRVLESERSC